MNMANEIKIVRLESGELEVHADNRSTGPLTWDEMLGCVAQLTMPDRRNCLNWLKTKEQAADSGVVNAYRVADAMLAEREKRT